MKYPQLVPTRAVNAISDWLVTRLEHLGVEAPQLYTRLLLSLLQSSVQINDPIEFSNLEKTFFAARKGNQRRHHLPCDTDTLKKLNAIQCLREIVSSEQELITIENLVDELCEKLKDIEKQTADIQDEDQVFGTSLAVATPAHQLTNIDCHASLHCVGQPTAADSSTLSAVTSVRKSQGAVDIETDPKKRYFSAFPALTKEMEDSFRAWRRNTKSLTWPADRANTSVSSSSSNSTQSTSLCSKETKSDTLNGMSMDANVSSSSSSMSHVGGEHADKTRGAVGEQEHCVGGNNDITSASVKRKSKRRRNQAMSKGKTNQQNIRKNSTGNGGGIVGGEGRRYNAGNATSTFWDTDFEGCWEMGHDLIEEFIKKQNKNNRHRSTSESAAYNKKTERAVDIEAQNFPNKTINEHVKVGFGVGAGVGFGSESSDDNHPNVMKSTDNAALSPIVPIVDISFCCDDDYDDTLASVPELAMDNGNYPLAAGTRRLYQRDANNYGSHELLVGEDTATTNESIDEVDFARFKAKFNSSVEALWNNAEDEKATTAFTEDHSESAFKFASLPVVAPFKEDLKNFWTNYYNQQSNYTEQTMLHGTDMKTKLPSIVNDSCMRLSADVAAPATESSDYYSMPSNLEKFDKSVGGCAAGGGRRQSPIGVFLQNSIWSDNCNANAGDSDEAFLLKAWNSAKNNNNNHNQKQSTDFDSTSAFDFAPYRISKWSEGINAGPNAQQHHQQQLQSQHKDSHQSINQLEISIDSIASDENCVGGSNRMNGNFILSNMSSNSSVGIDCTDSSIAAELQSSTFCAPDSTRSLAAFHWQTPVTGQRLQVDLQSWSTSNPTTLTEMYGDISNATESTILDDDEIPSVVTLPNHSPTTSAFLSYDRIRAELKAHPAEKPQSYAPPSQSLLPKESYSEDENLLTSERTHFHPIKTFADGHTFEICSALDVIDYERSASGCFYFEEEKYFEYTRSDNFMTEEEAASVVSAAHGGAGHSTAPLYALSNCEAANACGNGGEGRRRNKNDADFVIKFRKRNCEVACQTENMDAATPIAKKDTPPPRTELPLLEQHPLCLIFSGGAKLEAGTGGLACNDAIEALHKAVTAAAKAASDADNHWLPNAANICGSTRHPPSIWSTNAFETDARCDELTAAAAQQWPLHDFGQKCKSGNLYHNNNNNNNNIVIGSDDSEFTESNVVGLHSLWGMCAACNSEMKSMPADRLLCDELKLEADEIMSDLKYMQDLYIGRAGGSSADDESEAFGSDSDWDVYGEAHELAEDEDDEQNVHEKTQTQQQQKHNFEKMSGNFEANIFARIDDDDDDGQTKNIYRDYARVDDAPQPPNETKIVLQKVNKLIADLLHPEEVSESGSIAVLTAGGAKPNDDSLWYDKNARNIWQQMPLDNAVNADDGGENNNNNTNSTLKSIELLQRRPQNAAQAEQDAFLAKLSWEHDNLAKIWQNETPTPHSNTFSIKAIERSAAATPKMIKEIDDADNQTTTTGALLQSHANTAAIVTKYFQQFLNNTNNANAANDFTTSANVVKQANRKRRHSASQNIFHYCHNEEANAKNNECMNYTTPGRINNNKTEIVNFNDSCLKLLITQSAENSTTAANNSGEHFQQKFVKKSDESANVLAIGSALANIAGNNSNRNVNVNDTFDENGDEFVNGGRAKQTIITCKYWALPECEGHSAAFPCLMDKNASILKHVAMVTRPLTR